MLPVSFLRLAVSVLLLKSVAICSPARQIDRRSIFYASPGVQYSTNQFFGGAPFASSYTAAPATPPQFSPAAFTHQVFHSGFGLAGQKGLVPVSYGSVQPQLAQPQPFFAQGAHNHLEEDVEPYYYHGERILKQYLVREKEHQREMLLLDQHLGNPFRPAQILRYETRTLPFGGVVDVPVFDTNGLEPQLHPFKPSSLRKNHGPVALGSGALGLITLPNGNVYLGSGSLGYVSEQQHVDTLVKPTPNPSLAASPIHFGSN